MIIKIPDEFDSKFRFIIVAAERAKQLQNGAPARVSVKSRKASYIAIREVEQQLVPFKILEKKEKEDQEEEETQE
ncbi:MAG: DNA-directed RNA polymerase subunit omega [Acidobacteria bacterium]|nr:DNA-directed RNA polymerase subunit omega [Acidobacteriota bacterium]MCZ6770097.1 DNA-directed RNA polymerase subunit omega [Acidobacteriota bacterium]MCZ6878540.1 DNA-directed RNA polymerase subunit omega [Acidobacteriota bacterium]